MEELELYTLGDDFLPRKMIQPYISAIWTERYSAAGDMQVVVQAPSILADELSRGRFLAARGSKEIMVVESRTIENGLLTVTGPSLIKFFEQREAWFENPAYKAGNLPVPSPEMVAVHDFGGPVPWTVTVPAPDSEEFDGRTVLVALCIFYGAAPAIDHENPVNSVPIWGDSFTGGGFTNYQQAWRLEQDSDLTFTLRDAGHATTGHVAVRVYLLRGLKPAPIGGETSNNFGAGYGTNPPAIAGTSSGGWPAGNRWIAWMIYRRTVLSGHTVPAGGVIDGSGSNWTDDKEFNEPVSPGLSLRIRSAHDFNGSALGVRPNATFHPSVEWTDPPTDSGFMMVCDFSTDDAQPLQPKNSSIPLYADYTDTKQIGEFLAYVVSLLLIAPGDFAPPYTSINFEWAQEAIPGLSLGAIDENGAIKQLTFPIGPVYDGIESLASEQNLGFKLYLESASINSGFTLMFATYRGVNRTSSQTDTRMIRMSPDMDSLLSSKEFISAENYKNLVYVTFKNQVSMHYLGTTEPLGFNRRVIRVDAPDNTHPSLDIVAYRSQVAWNTLLQHMQAWAVDGQVHTISLHKFGKDYYLGDVIELQGNDGVIQMAQVTEHIRSQDQTGFKEYPTLAVIDPTMFSFIDDLGGLGGDQDWYGDPSYDIGDPID